MQVDVTFGVAKVYNIDEKIDVVKGQEFSIQTDHINPSEVKWFTNEDQVLSLLQKGSNAELKALDLGTSTILIMGTDFGIIKKLTVKVVADVFDNAVDLGASVGSPENK